MVTLTIDPAQFFHIQPLTFLQIVPKSSFTMRDHTFHFTISCGLYNIVIRRYLQRDWFKIFWGLSTTVQPFVEIIDKSWVWMYVFEVLNPSMNSPAIPLPSVIIVWDGIINWIQQWYYLLGWGTSHGVLKYLLTGGQNNFSLNLICFNEWFDSSVVEVILQVLEIRRHETCFTGSNTAIHPPGFQLDKQINLNQKRPLLSVFSIKDTQSGLIYLFQIESDA